MMFPFFSASRASSTNLCVSTLHLQPPSISSFLSHTANTPSSFPLWSFQTINAQVSLSLRLIDVLQRCAAQEEPTALLWLATHAYCLPPYAPTPFEFYTAAAALEPPPLPLEPSGLFGPHEAELRRGQRVAVADARLRLVCWTVSLFLSFSLYIYLTM